MHYAPSNLFSDKGYLKRTTHCHLRQLDVWRQSFGILPIGTIPDTWSEINDVISTGARASVLVSSAVEHHPSQGNHSSTSATIQSQFNRNADLLKFLTSSFVMPAQIFSSKPASLHNHTEHHMSDFLTSSTFIFYLQNTRVSSCAQHHHPPTASDCLHLSPHLSPTPHFSFLSRTASFSQNFHTTVFPNTSCVHICTPHNTVMHFSLFLADCFV